MSDFFFPSNRSLRREIAREAAILLYTSQEKEYKQAKERAANILGSRLLPTNREVADELDLLAEEREGQERHERIVRMRREALDIMEVLESFQPRLIGSVWRGTAHLNSDIDIMVFSSNREQVVNKLRDKDILISRIEHIETTKLGGKFSFFHIKVNLASGDEVEIIVKDPSELEKEEECAVYGDKKRGLNSAQIKRVLGENPLQKFVPKKRLLGF